MKLGTYFSGGGVADIGYKAAGFEPTFAVEFDPANEAQSMRIADCYERNLGAHVIRQPVQNVAPADLPYVDLFHASPVCKNASRAKAGGEENDVDMVTAQATCDYIAHHRPLFVVIENVYGYRNFDAYKLILATLRANGYEYRAEKMNAADYGVPQTRERLIVTASRVGRPPSVPKTHMKEPPTMPSLFDVALPRWVGWYESIEDLIDTLPDDKFADWQLERLPDEMKTFLIGQGQWSLPKNKKEPSDTVTSNKNQNGIRAFIMNPANPNGNEKRKYRWGDEPTKTVTAGDSQSTKAFVVNGTPNSNGATITVCQREQPIFTLTATNFKRPTRASVPGRVVRMTPRALARFQSIPDSYVLPTRITDACCLIGNGVPSLMTQRIGETLKRMKQKRPRIK